MTTRTRTSNSSKAVTAGAGSRPALAFLALFGWTLFFLASTNRSAASSFTVLHAFGNGTDGAGIQSAVTLHSGRIYGTTAGGGAYGYGTVFKLIQGRNGQWSERILHSFQLGDPDGQEPLGNVIFDDVGNLYGTTNDGLNLHGTVFEMSPGPGGWSLTVLYTFCQQPDCADGGSPWAGLAFDKEGNLYGTAGNVFELKSGMDGWTENVLYNFCAQPGCSDGRVPYEGVILDGKGNLYGVTHLGGDPNGGGVVYKVQHRPDGSWFYRVLHRFHGPPDDGQIPSSAMLLAMDAGGNLYGTTNGGGRYPCVQSTCGVVFRLTHQPDGHWNEDILHQFKYKSGYWPGGGVVIDSAGNLYGTTGAGGDKDCQCGAVYKLSPNPDGTWTYTILHRFTGLDGLIPNANLVMDDTGNLYGTTQYGGSGGGGVVFELTP